VIAFVEETARIQTHQQPYLRFLHTDVTTAVNIIKTHQINFAEIEYHLRVLQISQGPSFALAVARFSRKVRGWNRKPHAQCESCWKRNCNISHNKQSGEAGLISLLKDTLGQLSSITTTSAPSSLNNSVASHDQSGTTLDDQI